MKFSISVPIYNVYVNVYIGDTQDHLDIWERLIYKSSGLPPPAVPFLVSGRSYEIYINKKGFRCADIVMRKSTLSFGVIAHEILHSVNRIMDFVDIPLTYESEEAYTYLNEYLNESIHRKLKSTLKDA